MEKAINILKGLKFLDGDGTLNLSGLLFVVITVRLGNEQIDWPLVAALLLVLSNYNLKKFWRYVIAKRDDALEQRLVRMESELKALTTVHEMQKLATTRKF